MTEEEEEEEEVTALFADINAYIGKTDNLEEINADKNLIENYLYEGGILNELDGKRDLEAGYQAFADRAVFVESLKPENERSKEIFGISVRRSAYEVIKCEAEISAYFALKKCWLHLLETERKLLKESNNIPKE